MLLVPLLRRRHGRRYPGQPGLDVGPDLPVDVVQIDDGYQRGIGDWLDADPRFGDLRAVVAAIRGEGRRAGIWLAPFLVGARSALAAAHPEWLLPEAWAGSNWGQELRVLDISRLLPRHI